MEHLWVMDVWPKRINFRKALQALAKREGWSRPELAERLELNEGSLHSLFYDKTRKAGLEVIQRAAVMTGKSITEFIDDPGQPIAGQDASHLSDKRRFLAGLMFDGITADDLSDDDAQLLYEDYLAAKARLIAMKTRIRTQGGTT